MLMPSRSMRLHFDASDKYTTFVELWKQAIALPYIFLIVPENFVVRVKTLA
ncbi:MAG: hypothetical protein H0X31_13810 [Nostocaceae cyanobacterium]|nr:hypothetical protein [Nostocaceae cyanobacterium]